ncbi:hypothetical protein Plhal304r1_c040g0117961 [Plasmopara halstedii]
MMVNLLCAIVGAASYAFEVNIDDTASVSALKKAVKAENPDTIKCEAAKLELFLAKTEGGAWLDSTTDDVKKLKKGEKTALIEALTHEDNELDGTFGLEDYLVGMPEPKTRQIHVLVVIPAGNSADIGVTPSRLLKYKQQDTDAGSIQPTKKDV